ncbi:F0F1 ATP synthase subunit delta [Candidatus Enterovibrio escicola]|uniref:ATP synthase subunit delta n=1 Tax=Candidatus Enterovibrio escicola TaxID=1927127 RepID=A0A2A5T547_9GAMM|nr:F0F1 ATP synthase subunit delta [Candidatus Enterovibrio escacola]PCS23292.1 ATP synthase delta chain [Candidatus Enterovibrio escacola]
MSELTTIVRPYAKAVFDLAIEKGELDQWSEMLYFAAEVSCNEVISDYIGGMHSISKLADLFICVCGEQLNEFGQNLVRIMAENNRLKMIPEMYIQFMALRHNYEKQVDVYVFSAIVLDSAQLDAIARKLEVRLARNIRLDCSVDETLIAGVVIRVGDLVIDNSVSGSIRRLKDTLQS